MSDGAVKIVSDLHNNLKVIELQKQLTEALFEIAVLIHLIKYYFIRRTKQYLLEQLDLPGGNSYIVNIQDLYIYIVIVLGTHHIDRKRIFSFLLEQLHILALTPP